MNKKEKEFLKEKGWKLVEGIKIYADEILPEEGDVIYFPSIKDIPIQECSYWTDEEGEICFEDDDSLLEWLGYEKR